ncbi:SPASM domain-containing protein [Paludibacteraceae bacterium OttesenSCG-928-F17]|nr:SPASM domain-containing protein [Paludibacteraceae bacterium OttesenSCG-928-F17]
MLNIIKLRTSYLFSRKHITGFKNVSPSFISVEPANFCQLHCPECPVGNSRTKKGTVSTFNETLFNQLINKLKVDLVQTIFYFQGEPFLHKKVCEMIKYAHNARIYTSTSTNAQIITSDLAKDIVESGLDNLIVSIDGTTQEVYEKYRVGGSLQKALEAVEHINHWKETLNSVTPMVEIQFLVLKTNEHQMEEMKGLCKKIKADKLTFKTAQLYDFENGHPLLTSKDKYARYKKGKDGKYHIRKKQRNRCWRLWSGAVVNTNGDVLPCCFDKNADYSFGNINETSFMECWHSKKASGFRERILKNRKQYEMCRNCTS